MHGFLYERKKVFIRGLMKYLILDLLTLRPMHGYELMNEISKKFSGLYTPSPGVIYPTLSLLEDLGYISHSKENGKKVYSVTREGKKYLLENRDKMEKIKSIREKMGDFKGKPFLQELSRIFRLLMVNRDRITDEKAHEIRNALASARQRIEEIVSRQGK